MALVIAKAVIGLGLLVVLGLAAAARAPRRAPAARDLRWLLAGVALLYAAAAAAALSHRTLVAEAACAVGVGLAALAGWLSRGDDGGGDSGDPSGGPPVDWERFDRARHAWDRPRASSPR